MPLSFKTKRCCTYATILFYNLSNGIDYAIIFPTIWNYVHLRYHGSQSMFGFIIAAYSISSFIVNPIVGYWKDKTNNTKSILILASLAEMLGSIMYFIGYSKWFLAGSRLVSGLGGGALSAVVADIAHTTSEEDRTSVLAMIVASQQFGILIGPIFNLFLSKMNFYIGSFPVDKYSSPGWFMAIIWLTVVSVIILFYYDLITLKDEEDMANLFTGYKPQEPSQSDFEVSTEYLLSASYPNYSTVPLDAAARNLQNSSSSDFQSNSFRKFDSTIPKQPPNAIDNLIPKVRTTSESNHATDKMIESAERFIQSASTSYQATDHRDRHNTGDPVVDIHSNLDPLQSNPLLSTQEEKPSYFQNFNFSFFRDEVIVLLGLAFFSTFSQTCLETIVTPLGKKFYGFEEMENSILYFLASIEALVVFFSIRYISHRFSDRTIILCGIMALCIAFLLSLIFLTNNKPNQMSTFPYFVIIVIIDLIGISVTLVCVSSLLSKIIDQDCQALAQGFRRSLQSLGCIFGPLWGGAYLNHLIILFAAPLSALCLISILFLCSFKRMKPTQNFLAEEQVSVT